MKKPLSGWTEAEQQLGLSQQKSLKMPGTALGQPPARGTLGLVVYLPDSSFSRLVSPPFNVALILPLPSQHAGFLVAAHPTYDYTPQKSLLRVPARSGRRPSSLDCSSQKPSGEVLPSLISRTTIPRDFSFLAVLFLLYLFLSWLGFADQPAHSHDVTRRDPAQGFLSGSFSCSLSYPLFRLSRLA